MYIECPAYHLTLVLIALVLHTYVWGIVQFLNRFV
jgi:hypothetical protein